MNTKDLTVEEYENLAEVAFSDDILIDSFMERNQDDFLDYLTDLGIETEGSEDHEYHYLEFMDDEFLEFAYEYYKSLEGL